MVKQQSGSRRVSSGRQSSNGAAVLDRPTPVNGEARPRRSMRDEIVRVSRAIQQGSLAERARLDNVEGTDREAIEDLNAMLDAVVNPFQLTTEYLECVARGEVPSRLADAGSHESDKVRKALNSCTQRLECLQRTTEALEGMASNDYSQTLEVDKDSGLFGALVAAVNSVTARINHVAGTVANVSRGDLSELADYKKIGRRSQRDQLVPGLIDLMENMNELAGEVERLTEASRQGQLSERGKTHQFQGAYAGIVKGVNEMLDAILLPIGEGNRILAQISNGKIDELIAQTYKGDHEKMKQAVNNVASVLQAAERTGAPDRGLAGRTTLRARQSRSVPGRLRRHRAGRQRNARCDPAAYRRRQPHSGADLRTARSTN